MKILLISFGFQEYVVSLANSLSNTEKVVLCVPNNLSNCEPFSKLSSNVTIEKFNLPKIWNPKIVYLISDMINLVKKYLPDIVHVQESGHPMLLPFFLYLRLKNIQLVNTLHDVKPHLGEENIQKHYLDWVIKYFTKNYIVHGNFLKAELSSYMHIPLTNISVIPHGNFSIYKEWQISKFDREDSTILFFGRIHEYKGLDILLDSIKLIGNKLTSFKVIIAGKIYNFEEYKKKIKANNQFIELHDYRIPHSKVCEFFQRCSLVVLPYKEASQSGVVPLAFAFGKPVVVTDVGSISEIVDNGIDGYVVPSNNSKKLAKSILDILEDKETIDRMSKNAYRKSRELLSWDRISRLTRKVYISSLIKSKYVH